MAHPIRILALLLVVPTALAAEPRVATLRPQPTSRGKTKTVAAAPRVPLGDPASAVEQLRAALAKGQNANKALEALLDAAPSPEVEARGRLIAAVAAFRSGDGALARRMLAAPVAERDDFVGAYSQYLLGLLTRDAPDAPSHRHFTAAYQRAGTTELRYRAALWLAEDAGGRGDAVGALALLDSVAGSPVDEELGADLAVRRALLLDRVGRAEEARTLLAELYLSRPLLGYRAATEPLFKVLRTRLGALERLPFARRVARAEALSEAGHPREAAREATTLMAAARGADRDRLNLLLARGELSRRSPRAALDLVKKIPAGSPSRAQARLLRGQALRQLGNKKEAELELVRLVADREAGAARIAAAVQLARALEDDQPARAAAYWELVANESAVPDEADDAAWRCGWSRYGAGEHLDAASWFGRLAARSSERRMVARGTYWGARSLERAQRREDAAVLYSAAMSLEPVGYYGMIARERLRALATSDATLVTILEAAEREATPVPPADPEREGAAPVREALKPARELLAMGLGEDALGELEFQARRFPSEAAPRALLAQVYQDSGDYLESVRWLRRAYPDLEQRGLPEGWWPRLYPLPYWDSIRKNAESRGLDPYFAAAVIYQESRFRSEARSSAGALGLMQIMPGTGREIARKLREPGFETRHLLEPERNIRYGTWYLSRLIEDLGGSAVHALAGYNAGSARARRWSSAGWADIDEYVEAIPFRETRLYVKNILVAHQGYHRTYQGSPDCRLLR